MIPSFVRKVCARMSAQSAVASMKTVKRAAIAAPFLLRRNEWPRSVSGTTRFCLLAYFRLCNVSGRNDAS
jgi:hypothetical protein